MRGEFTFLFHKGSSVIYYCCGTVDSLKILKMYSVGIDLFSLYMLLELELEIGQENNKRYIVQPILPKLKWEVGGEEKYKSRG